MTPFAPSTFPAMSRRSFLQAIAIGALAGSSFETVGRAVFGDVPDAWASPAAPTDGLLVVVTLFALFDLRTPAPGRRTSDATSEVTR